MKITNAEEAIKHNNSRHADIEEGLAIRSPALAKQPADMLPYSNYFNNCVDQGLTPGPGIHKFLNIAEEERSDPKYKLFDYYINDIGFRDPYPTTDNKVFGFFGCSMTLGEGLPSEDNFPSLLANKFNIPCLNLGLPGIGAHRIAQIFAASANIWNIDTALVTLPNWARFHYVDSQNDAKSIHLPYPTKDRECELVRMAMLREFSDQYMLSASKDAINYIITVAKLKNIKLILTSWDPDVSRMIEYTTGYEAPHYNLWEPSVALVSGDHARDGMHPGVNIVNRYVDKITACIKDGHYV
jgi:hypothetical protein